MGIGRTNPLNENRVEWGTLQMVEGDDHTAPLEGLGGPPAHRLGANTIDGASYAVDAVGNRSFKTNQLNGVTENYAYDQIYQLTQVLQGATTTESYTYDQVGNRLSSLGVPSYSYNNSNQLTSTSTAAYTYDNNGNTLSKTEGSNLTSYVWDYENRLTQVTLPGGAVVTFKYDPFQRRIQKSSATGTTNYAYDGEDIIEEAGTAGLVLARYTQGAGIDEPLAMVRAGATSYYQADGLGSITSLTDASGGLVTSYTYDSFGRLTASSGTVVNALRYTARDFDSETGPYLYRARYYDPSPGRFLNEDPIGFDGGGDFYRYVSNSPVNLVDPTGFAPCKLPIYCDPGALKAIKSAYMKAILLNGGFTASNAGTQVEAGFPVSPTPSGGYQAGAVVSGDHSGKLDIPLPTAAGGATFHTHMKGDGMPSTPKNNTSGSAEKGDTLAAVQTGFDVYVISGNGLSLAPANSKDPTTGKDSHFIIKGDNFDAWFKALKALCAKLAGGN